jgi:hypothetical protein
MVFSSLPGFLYSPARIDDNYNKGGRPCADGLYRQPGFDPKFSLPQTICFVHHTVRIHDFWKQYSETIYSCRYNAYPEFFGVEGFQSKTHDNIIPHYLLVSTGATIKLLTIMPVHRAGRDHEKADSD